ncbi:hypothetical protein HN011_005515 [Eciton burchellii]|nr:hypothetical protein HN011_005515 [Eciton burchellii]
MAALRLHAHGNFVSLLNSIRSSNHVARTCLVPTTNQIQRDSKRWSSYKSSPTYKTPDHYTDYEITSDPNEWKYVERTFRYKVIPKPPMGNIELPSGFKPVQASPRDNPYFIERTKNYMQSVHLLLCNKGVRKITRINKIQGDIWMLEHDIKEFIEKNVGEKLATQINEYAGTIKIRGDYVNRIKEWMDMKGF